MTIETDKNRKTIAEVILNVLALALLIFVMTRNIGLDNMPALMNDEFGYWGNAVSLTDIDWSPLREQTPYYSNGYSFVLAFLIMIMKAADFSSVYRAAVCVNILFICIGYLCAWYCCRVIFEKNPVKTIGVAFISNFAAATLFYVHMNWPEAMITMLMWIQVALFISLVKNFSWIRMGACYLVLVIMYLTHQRAIGVVVVFFVAMILLLIKNKKKVVYVIPILAGIAVVFGIQLFSDKFFAHDINVANTTANNLMGKPSGTFERYKTMVVDHFPLLIYSFAGKLFCANITSLGLWLLPIVSFVKRVISSVKNKKADLSDECLIEFFLAGSFVVMLLLNSVTTLPASRKDLIVYTRYMDYAFGPLCILMIDIFLKDARRYLGWIVGGFVYTAAISLLIQYRFETVAAGFSIYCSPVVGSFFRLCSNDERIVAFLCVMLLTVALIMIFGIMSLKSEKMRLSMILLVFIIANLFSYHYACDWLEGNRNHYHRGIDPIFEKIDEYPDHKIYFIKDDENYRYSTYPKYLQFVLEGRTVEVIEKASELPAEGEYFVLTNIPEDAEYYKGQLLERSDLLELFIVKA